LKPTPATPAVRGYGHRAHLLVTVHTGGGTRGSDGVCAVIPFRATPVVAYGNVGAVDAAVSPRPTAAIAWVALGVVYVLWGSTYLGNRLIIADVPPLFAGGARFLVGGSLLGLVVLAVAGRTAFRMTWQQLGTTALSGLLLPAWGNGLVTIAQQKVASGLAALLIAAVPLYIVVLRALTGDRPRPATLVGVGVGVTGLAILVLTGSSGASGGVHGSAWWGPWLVLLAGLGWATGTFATTRLPVPANPFALAAVQMFVGGAILMSVSQAAGERFDVGSVSAVAWWAWAYMAVVVSLAAFGAYAFALASLPVSTVATYAYVNPVIAVLLGVVVANERFSAPQLLGGAVVLVAVVLVIAAERPRKRRGELAASGA
jgi:drug/metabolite transporter (DMT)-like permease